MTLCAEGNELFDNNVSPVTTPMNVDESGLYEHYFREASNRRRRASPNTDGVTISFGSSYFII